MIKKLRTKFVIISFLSVFLILAVTFTTVNVTNFINIANDADDLTAYLIKNEGKFIYNEGEMPDPFEQTSSNSQTSSEENNSSTDSQSLTKLSQEFYVVRKGLDETSSEEQSGQPFVPPPPGGKETKYDTRFFTVKYFQDGTIIANTLHISSFDDEKAINVANSYRNLDKGWAMVYYRFRCANLDDGSRFCVFVDYTRQLYPSYNFLWTSLIAGSAGLALALLLIILLSKRVVKPIVDNNLKQKRFISDSSHELKTPLTIISANTEIIELTNGESEETKTIRKQLTKLTDMVKDLNTLAKIDEKHEIVAKKVDLSGICKDIVKDFQDLFIQNNIDLKTEINDSISIKGDESMLRKLLDILLDNANKYALTYTKITLTGASSKATFIIENDADMEYEGDMQEVFQRFYRSRTARASEVEGSGIGLAMAYEIVNLHKGKIKANSDKGRFTIRIDF